MHYTLFCRFRIVVGKNRNKNLKLFILKVYKKIDMSSRSLFDFGLILSFEMFILRFFEVIDKFIIVSKVF